MSETVLKRNWDMIQIEATVKVCNFCHLELCVCVTCLKNKSAGEYNLCCLVTLLALLEKGTSFTITALCLCSGHGNWIHILGSGMWIYGNLCYVTGLSGKGEQWLTAPVWKALGLREKNARSEASRPELKQSPTTWRKVQVIWPDQMYDPGLALRGHLFNMTHPIGWLIFALEAFNIVLHKVCLTPVT